MKGFVFAGLCAFFAVFLLKGASHSAEVGLYNAGLDGGMALGVSAIRNTLEDAGIEVEEFSHLSIENLLNYRAVIIPNTSRLASGEAPRWVDNLRAYVEEAGGALIFCHDAIGAERSPFGRLPLFPEILAPGTVERSVDRKVAVAIPDALTTGFDYLPGYETGQTEEHMYNDRFVFVQSGGKAVLVDAEKGKTVVGVGEVGRGRVVFNGMYGARPDVPSLRLEGVDRDVMVNTVKWTLAGDGPVVSDPARLEVSRWRPEAEEAAETGTRVAAIGSNVSNIREPALEKIRWAGIEYDFIPFNLIPIRGLSVKDYGLVFFFAPTSAQERDMPEETFGIITDYTEAGGRAVIFLPGDPGARTQSHFLEPAGSRLLKRVRDNPDELRTVKWIDGEAGELRFHSVPETWFTSIAEPAGDEAEAVGYWYDYTGEQKSPAIIKTDYGYILNVNYYDDHRLFTVNASIELFPDIRREVFKNLLERYDEKRAFVTDSGLSREGKRMYWEAEIFLRSAAAAAEAGNFRDANRSLLQAENKLVKAYAASLPAVPGEKLIAHTEGRAMITDMRPSPVALQMPDPEIICKRLAASGFTGVKVGFRPELEARALPPAGYDEREYDWMQEWIDTAREHGLEFGTGYAPFEIGAGDELFERAVEEDWSQVRAEEYGRERQPLQPDARGLRGNLCRSRPEVVEHAVGKSLELLKYPMDFIILDVIRWAGPICYCDACREQFQASTGIEIQNWPDDVLTKYQDEYADWRSEPITAVVRGVAENISLHRPETKLGVFTRTPAAGRREGQYWWEWGDYVDFNFPMYYSADLQGLEERLRAAEEMAPAGEKLRMISAVAPPADRRGGSYFTRLRQHNLQRKYAPAGIYYFSYRALTDDYLELLGMFSGKQTQ